MTTLSINSKSEPTIAETVMDMTVGVTTLVTATALAAKATFATLGTPAIVAKVLTASKAGLVVGGIFGGPIGWAILGAIFVAGAVYFGYKGCKAGYKAYKAYSKANNEKKLSESFSADLSNKRNEDFRRTDPSRSGLNRYNTENVPTQQVH